MNNKRKNILAILSIILIGLLAVAAIWVSYRLGTNQPVIPTGTRAASCSEECPTSKDSSILNNCTPPEVDGSPQTSVCNETGRVESCGGTQYCCPSPGGAWTTNMTACPSGTTPTPTPTAPAAGSKTECQSCTNANQCATGLTCDLADGRCKKTDGTSACFETSAACSTTATVLCVPSGTVTCTPDCPTTCGQATSIITTCKNSCGVATTKNCPATAACPTTDVTIDKVAYRDNTTTEITTAARNQTFIYALKLKNTGTATISGAVVTDELTGNNQELLTFVSAGTGCTFTQSDKTVTCNNISLQPNATKTLTFKVKLSGTAENGTIVSNEACVTAGSLNKCDSLNITANTILGCNQTCTSDNNCSTGLTCDTTSGTCRKAACADVETCVCPTATTAPTSAGGTQGGSTAGATTAPTEAQPSILPETGILDFPGVAAFGGGLMLAIVGILLAL